MRVFSLPIDLLSPITFFAYFYRLFLGLLLQARVGVSNSRSRAFALGIVLLDAVAALCAPRRRSSPS